MDNFSLFLIGSAAIGTALEALSSARKQRMFYALLLSILSVACSAAFGIAARAHLPSKVLARLLGL